MKRCLMILLAGMLAQMAWGVGFTDQLRSPDDIMLRPKVGGRKSEVGGPKSEVEGQKKVTDYVTQTNVVVKTDYVTQTNVVTQTERVQVVVPVTNVVVKTDYVTQTNVIVRKDYVTQTNVVVVKKFDEREKQALEAKVRELEASRKSLETQANDAAQQALTERAARENAERKMKTSEARVQAELAAATRARTEAEAARAAAQQAEAEANELEVGRPKAEGKDPKAKGKGKNAEAKGKNPKKLTGRAAVITASRTDYDRKQGVIFFDKNVYVDDEQYQMRADRLFVFLEGTNELKRIVALGNVSITNDMRAAHCTRAMYSKKTGKIILFGGDGQNARLDDFSQKDQSVVGKKITYWLNSEQVEVEDPVITAPGSGGGGKVDPRKMLFGK